MIRRTKTAAIAIGMLAALAAVAYGAEPAPKPPAAEPKPKVEVDNPIREISAMMKKAGKLLDALETGSPTQEEQKKILAELDRLIEMAQKSESSSSQQQAPVPAGMPKPQQPLNTGGASGSSPLPDSRDVVRPVRPHLGEGAPDLREIWGKLPDAPRDEVLQILDEHLPHKYKWLLDLYFKALSEKK